MMKQLQKEEKENMHHVQNAHWNFVDKANGLSPRETVEYSGKNRPARGRTNGVWVQNGSIAGSQIHALVGDETAIIPFLRPKALKTALNEQ